MSKREDFPGQDPEQRGHVHTGGLDDVWVRRARALPRSRKFDAVGAVA